MKILLCARFSFSNSQNTQFQQKKSNSEQMRGTICNNMLLLFVDDAANMWVFFYFIHICALQCLFFFAFTYSHSCRPSAQCFFFQQYTASTNYFKKSMRVPNAILNIGINKQFFFKLSFLKDSLECSTSSGFSNE